MQGARWSSPWVLSALAGGIAALAVAAARPSDRVPVLRPPRAEVPASRAAHGLEYLAEVELVPDAVVRAGATEAIEYHAEITTKGEVPVGVAWSVRLFTDRGKLVATQSEGSNAGLPGAVVNTSSFCPRVADGFYELRAEVATAASDRPGGTVRAIQHLRVHGGKMFEITDAEWFEKSDAQVVELVPEESDPQ